MAFAQLTLRESLRDIEACLRAQKGKPYHMWIRGRVSRSTLADANERRDWRIYADLAQALIHTARSLCADEDLGLDLDNTIYALDASTIDSGRVSPGFLETLSRRYPRDQPVTLICRTGNRSDVLARHMMEQMGYTRGNNVRDGITHQIADGFPTRRVR